MAWSAGFGSRFTPPPPTDDCFFQQLWLKRLILLHQISFASLSKIKGPHLCGSISGLGCPLDLCVCSSATPCVFGAVALQRLQLGGGTLPAFLLFPQNRCRCASGCAPPRVSASSSAPTTALLGLRRRTGRAERAPVGACQASRPTSAARLPLAQASDRAHQHLALCSMHTRVYPEALGCFRSRPENYHIYVHKNL